MLEHSETHNVFKKTKSDLVPMEIVLRIIFFPPLPSKPSWEPPLSCLPAARQSDLLHVWPPRYSLRLNPSGADPIFPIGGLIFGLKIDLVRCRSVVRYYCHRVLYSVFHCVFFGMGIIGLVVIRSFLSFCLRSCFRTIYESLVETPVSAS